MTDDGKKRKIMTATPPEVANAMTRRQILRMMALGGTSFLLPSILGCRPDIVSPEADALPQVFPGAASYDDCFLGEIKIVSFNFNPKNWALCNGQLLPISGNQALFALLGTTYGGNGSTNFALPDLRGRTPMHFGNGHTLGEKGGQEAHTVTISEMPQHYHQARASGASATANVPNLNVLGGANNLYAADEIDPETGLPRSSAPAPMIYASAGALTTLRADTLSNVGGSQAHQNMQPFLTLNFCIATQGIFPSQNVKAMET